MTPKAFAYALRRVIDERETSWSTVEKRYTKNFSEIINQCFPKDWAGLAGLIIHSGVSYYDIVDWADNVDHTKRAL